MGRRAVPPALVVVFAQPSPEASRSPKTDPSAPWPSAEEVADRGFPVWPEDTFDEEQDVPDDDAVTT